MPDRSIGQPMSLMHISYVQVEKTYIEFRNLTYVQQTNEDERKQPKPSLKKYGQKW